MATQATPIDQTIAEAERQVLFNQTARSADRSAAPPAASCTRPAARASASRCATPAPARWSRVPAIIAVNT